jgi:hypothetical protein
MKLSEINNITLWFLGRLFVVLLFLVGLNEVYKQTSWQSDVQKYSRVRNRIDSAFASGDVIYLGESSNTSFNPWTDTLNQSIGDFLQLYLGENKKVEQITHEGYHPGIFLEMLNLAPDLSVRSASEMKTIVLGVNMRTCGPSAMFSGNEASNQREALFYSNRPPLMTRVFMGLHFYDNRNELERERLKMQWWRTKDLPIKEKTLMNWNTQLAGNFDTAIHPDIKHMSGAYIKEFGFIIDDQNQRLLDLQKIALVCKQKNWNLVFHILPPNRYHAERLFGDKLLSIMDANYEFLKSKFSQWGVTVVDNYYLPEANQLNAENKGSFYTDQWYPTEHYNSVIRRAIAENIVKTMLNESPRSPNWQAIQNRVSSSLKQNNYPNWSIVMPLSDSLIKTGIQR